MSSTPSKCPQELTALFFVSMCLSSLSTCRSVDSFLKKGLTQADAQKRWEVYEVRRKTEVELVLREVYSNNARSNNRNNSSFLK